MVEQWFWLVVVGIILLLNSAPLSVLGLQAPQNWTITLWLLAEIGILFPLVLVVLLYRLARTQRSGQALALIVAVKEFLPHTARERQLWLLVSLTAGICEEIVFRGFLFVYFFALGTFFGQANVIVVVLLSSVLFGFSHIYQGWKGAVGTGVMGIVFAYLYGATGSLFLPIVTHILLDARVVFLAPAILKLSQSVKEDGVNA
jgi:membrane protease YdiL (CAAX protease family)